MKTRLKMGWIVGSLLLSQSVTAQSFTLPAGAALELGGATMDWACANLEVGGDLALQSSISSNGDSLLIESSGQVTGGTARLGLTGDFEIQGSFTPENSTVALSDGCSNTQSNIIGAAPGFRNLEVTTATGKQLVFPAQRVTQVTGQLTLQGAPGNLLQVRSSVPGVKAQLWAQANSVSYVDAADNYAVGRVIAPGTPASYNSVNSGNLLNWFDSLLIIPTLSTAGYAILVGLLMLVVGWRRRERGEH